MPILTSSGFAGRRQSLPVGGCGHQVADVDASAAHDTFDERHLLAVRVVQRLAGGRTAASMASASPDGKQVAFVKGIVGSRSVYVGDLVPAAADR